MALVHRLWFVAVALAVASIVPGPGLAAPPAPMRAGVPAPSDAPAPSVAVSTFVREVRVSPEPASLALRCSEPSIAAHPADPRRVAVACAQGAGPVLPMVRISHDGGLTWRTTASRPGGGGIHIVVAWGPGPRSGARLYVANMTGAAGRLRLGITWSDDEGAHWGPMSVRTDVPGWVGGTPDIVTDNDPTSPNHGTVYAAWNWPRSRTTGPGLRVIASPDHGRTWHGVEVPALPKTPGYAVVNRIGYRLAPAGDGSVLVDWYQADMRRWSSSAPLEAGSLGNVGRIRIGVARLAFDGKAGTWSRGPSLVAAELPRTSWNAGFAWPDGLATGPQWSASIRVDPETRAALLVVRDGGTSGHAWSASTDGGRTFSLPEAVTNARWSAARVSGSVNGVGLRDRAAVTADGCHVVFAYGDGRFGRKGANLVATFAAIVTVVATAPAATTRPPTSDQGPE